MNNSSTQKKELRQEIRKRKAACTGRQLLEYSQEICRLLEKHPYFRKAETVLLYCALPDEVDLTDLLTRYGDSKRFVLPVVKGDELELRLYRGMEGLSTDNLYHIPEPQGEEFHEKEAISLALIPGMAFTREGIRLGRGKGYYDRLLEDMSQDLYKIGVCFPFQLLPVLPLESHDVRMDEVVTLFSEESGINKTQCPQ